MNFLLMNGIFEITLDEEHNKLLLVKIQVRENCILLSMIWRSKTWKESVKMTGMTEGI